MKPKNKFQKQFKKYAKKYQKQFSQYRRPASLIALGIVVVFAVACGKMDSSPSAEPAKSASAAVVAERAKEEAADPISFSSWCERAGGMMLTKGGLCELQIHRMYGHGFMSLADQWWNTGLQVEVNDTVTVDVTGNPNMKIGSDLMEKARSGSYVAATSGSVEFMGRNISTRFSVRQVTLKRCYDPKGGTPRCPKQSLAAN